MGFGDGRRRRGARYDVHEIRMTERRTLGDMRSVEQDDEWAGREGDKRA